MSQNLTFDDAEAVEQFADDADADLSAAVELLDDLNARIDDDIEACEYLEAFQNLIEVVDEQPALNSLYNAVAEDHELGYEVYTVEEMREEARAQGGEVWGGLRGEVVIVEDNPEETSDQMLEQFVVDDGTAGANNGIQVTTWDNKNTEAVGVSVGDTVEITGIVAKTFDYQGGVGVDAKVTPETEVEEIDAEFDLGPDETTISGEIVSMDSKVLIARPVYEDYCDERDLRIQATLQNEDGMHDVNIRTDAVESIIGMSLEEAIEAAEAAMGSVDVIAPRAEDALLNEHVTLNATVWDDGDGSSPTFDVESAEDVDIGIDTESAEETAADAATAEL